MTYLLAVVIGVLSSFVASLIFLFFLSRIRPNLAISDKLAKNNDSDGETKYIIKVVNRTKRPIINVRARLDIVTRLNVGGGWVNSRKKVPLKIDEVYEIEGLDLNAPTEVYTWRFLTLENLDEIWDNDKYQYLKFQVSGVDSLSGFIKVLTKDYYFKQKSITEGEFEYGPSLNIL